MYKRLVRLVGVLGILTALTIFTNSTTTIPRAIAAQDIVVDRFIVKATKSADFAALQAELTASGAIVHPIAPQLNLMVVNGMGKVNLNTLRANSQIAGVGRDHVRRIVRPEMQQDLWGKAFSTERKLEKIKLQARPGQRAPDLGFDAITPDPSYNLPNTMWDYYRVGAVQVWSEFEFTGVPEVIVGVADTGIDFTHVDLEPKVIDVRDFTYLEEPFNICTIVGGFSDQDLADQFGGPVSTDWNGHGSWIGGNIAGALNGVGMNGIAPEVNLIALKISGWCGSAYDSEILAAIVWGADFGVDVINISFGGFVDRSDPQQDFIWNQYRNVVKYARTKGTAIVSSAGNEAVRIGKQGKVLSHGSLTLPGDPVADLFGLYETPGGIPGVVMVSALGNVVAEPSPSCTPETMDDINATCKPESDPHQAAGIGGQNHLAYYSNYGPRINVTAPGGARKFNLPFWDRGGTPGFPVTEVDGTFVWQSFSTMSNWGIGIACYDLSSIPGFTDDCYTTIQGTSMSSPHAAGVLAMIASARPDLRKSPKALIKLMENTATELKRNRTRVISATDTSPGDLTGVDCPTGYCHMDGPGGPFVSDSDAFGKGMVNAYDGVPVENVRVAPNNEAVCDAVRRNRVAFPIYMCTCGDYGFA